MEGINVDRSQTVAHVFHLFLSAGKACLLPFLTLYFRYLGLSALQTGAIVAIQCLCGVLIGPLWMLCASRCRKRRLVLMFSIFICISSGVLLSLVPSANIGGMAEYCNVTELDEAVLTTNGTLPAISTTLKPSELVSDLSTEDSGPVPPSFTSPKLTLTTTATTTSFSTTTTTTSPTTTTTSPTTSTTSPTTTTSTTSTPKHKKSNWERLSPELQDLILSLGYEEEDINAKEKNEFLGLKDQMEKILKAVHEEDNTEISGEGEINDGEDRQKRDIISSTLESINEKLASWQIQSMQYRTLAIVILIIVITQILSAPTEALADNMWFEFLDGLDFLERYGTQRVWSVLGVMTFPLIVTSVVDRTDCELLPGLHHFMLHFYFYACVLGVAFVLGFYFPLFSEKKKIVRKSSLVKGCRVICTDIHAFCYVFTLLLLGMITAAMDNFLFWQVQDLHGVELYMGGAVSIAALSQFVMYALSKFLIRKLSNPGCVLLALVLLIGRLVLYSFLWTPWPILPAALLHGATHTLIWACVENYPDFKANPLIMDRSAKSLLDSLYVGVAYALGSGLSGYLYERIGWASMLQGAALVVVGWLLLFALVQRCVRHKHKVRYAKLLQAEEDQESTDDEHDVYDGDWLEIALKHDK